MNIVSYASLKGFVLIAVLQISEGIVRDVYLYVA